MRVAIVCYYAPPLRAIASHRVLRLTRAMLAAGHEVHWVRADPSKMHDPEESLDESLRPLIPNQVVAHPVGEQALVTKPVAATFMEKVFRSLAFELPRFIGIDGFIGWSRVLRRRLRALVNENSIEAVVLCCSPHSQITTIPGLRRAFPDLRIFVDYRDLLSGNPWNIPVATDRRARRRQARLVKLERRLLRRADAVFVNTTMAREHFLRMVGGTGMPPVEVMRNAADYELADEVARYVEAPDLGAGVHLGFFGTLFPRRRLLPFLVALSRLPLDELDQITVHVYTDARDSKQLLAEDLAAVGEKVVSRVISHGYLPFAEALRHMQAMDALLLVNGPAADDAVFVPGKLFDYLTARRPVLFVGRAGDAADIVARACGVENCFTHEMPEPVAEAIAGLIGKRPADLEPLPEHAPAVTFRPLLSRLEAR